MLLLCRVEMQGTHPTPLQRKTGVQSQKWRLRSREHHARDHLATRLQQLSDARRSRLRLPESEKPREYDSLGHDAFVHRYLNPVVRDRLMVEMDKLTHAARNPDINAAGFNPRANRYLGSPRLGSDFAWTAAPSSASSFLSTKAATSGVT